MKTKGYLFKTGWIAVLSILLNFNLAFTLLHADLKKNSDSDENRVITSIININGSSAALKSSTKNFHPGLHLLNKTTNCLYNSLHSLICYTEILTDFRIVSDKYPRWSKCTFT
jgi:hypothetical protein